MLLTAGFLSVLALLPGLMVVAPDSSVVPHENRARAPAPVLEASWQALADFPDAAEPFLRDHIGLRYRLVQLRHYIKLALLGESPSDAIAVGRDGWLFLRDDHGLEIQRGGDLFAPDDLFAWSNLLGDLRSWLEARGIELLVVLAPDKASVHPDKLPDHFVATRGPTRTDQWVGHLSEQRLDVLDLREPLREAAGEVPLYHRLDTHWNGYGVAIAYREILEALSPLTAEAQPQTEFERLETFQSGDLGSMLHAHPQQEMTVEVLPRNPRAQRRGDETTDPEAQRPVLTFETDAPALPTAVVFRDSFATALIPLLAEHFKRSTWHWGRFVDLDAVETERPDVVILLFAERYLMAPVPARDLRLRASAQPRHP